MFKKFLLGFLGFLIVAPIVGALVGIKLAQFSAMAAAAASMVPPPTPVTVAEVQEETLHPRVSSVGSVVAVQGITVSTEAEGVVREIAFEAGSVVKAGDVLVKLDADVEESQLRAAEAAAELARTNATRARELFANRTISQAELDAAEAAIKQAEAQADNIRAIIRKKTVAAPFDGRLGIRRISLGEFLNKGAPVVSLQSFDPVYVEFSLPQQRLGDIADDLEVLIASDAYPEQPFAGTVTAVNPDVDPATRNFRVQATLKNPDGLLRPGMFVEVDLVLARSEKVLLIPATSVVHAPYGDSVYVLTEGEAAADGTRPLVVKQQPVRLGAHYGDFVVVAEGVARGDRIVSTGVFKLRPGMPVAVDNTLAPEFKLNPTPRNT